MTDLDELKAMASAHECISHEPVMSVDPTVVLELIDRVEKAEEKNDQWIIDNQKFEDMYCKIEQDLLDARDDVARLRSAMAHDCEITRLRALLARAREAMNSIQDHGTQMARFDVETHDMIRTVAAEIEKETGND